MPDPVKKFYKAERAKRLRQARITPKDITKEQAQKSKTPRGLEIRYSAFLTRIQKEVNKQIRAELAPLLKTILALRQDAIDDIVKQTFETALRVNNVIDKFLDPGRLVAGVTKQGRDITAFNAKKYDKKVYRILGLNNLPAGVELGIVNGWTIENIELIKDVNVEQVQKIRALMFRSVRDGARASDITSAIAKIMRSSVNRAALIARDQTLKLNGQLDRVKQQNAGLDRYIWRTSKDERVRAKHQAREGKSYTWKSGPPGGSHPGQEVQCRCTAEPDLEALLGKEFATERAPFPVLPKIEKKKPKPKPKPAKRPTKRAYLSKPRGTGRVTLTERQSTADQNARFLNNNLKRQKEATDAEFRDFMQWNWVHGSNRKVSIGVKEGLKSEFKLKGVIHNPRGFTTANIDITRMKKEARKVYRQTQKELRTRGIEKIKMYRGVTKDIQTAGVVESWTTDEKIAKKFAGKKGKVMVKEVEISKIYNYSGSSNWVNGIYGEQSEYMVLN